MLFDHRGRRRLSLHDWQDKLRKIHVQPENNQQVSPNILLEWDEIGRITTVRPFDRPWTVSWHCRLSVLPHREGFPLLI
jgi:hypothetical protein